MDLPENLGQGIRTRYVDQKLQYLAKKNNKKMEFGLFSMSMDLTGITDFL